MDEQIARLKALRQQARAALSAVNDSLDDLKDAIGSMDSEIVAIERELYGPSPAGARPTKMGEDQREICVAIRDLGGGPGAGWAKYAAIASALSGMDKRKLDRSLKAAAKPGRLLAQRGDSYQLLPHVPPMLDVN